MSTKRPIKGDVVLLRVDSYGTVYEGIVSGDWGKGEPLRDEFSMIECHPDFVFGTKELRLVDLSLNAIPSMVVDTHTQKIADRINKRKYYWLASARLVKNGKNVREK